jgi:VCBS repeat-containing protein
VLLNDSDPDAHDTLHVSAVNGTEANLGHAIKGTYGSLILNPDGSYSYNASSGGTKLGQDTFTHTVDDGHGGTASSTKRRAFTCTRYFC